MLTDYWIALVLVAAGRCGCEWIRETGQISSLQTIELPQTIPKAATLRSVVGTFCVALVEEIFSTDLGPP